MKEMFMTSLRVASNPRDFSKIVQQYEEKYKDLDSIYLSAITRFQNGADRLEKQEIESILYQYLLKWGRMGRVLGYNGCDRIAIALQQLKSQLDEFKSATLSNIDLNDKSFSIEELYDSLLNSKWKSNRGRTKRVGPTATAKVLHLALPNLFMIWDRRIREYYEFKDTGSEYLGFLEIMQDWNHKLFKTINSLQEKYGKSSTKLIDEYNWKRCWGIT